MPAAGQAQLTETLSLRIFVVLVKFLEGQVCDEGLFRKAGSVSRQRSLRVSVGWGLGLMERGHVTSQSKPLLRDFELVFTASDFCVFLMWK